MPGVSFRFLRGPQAKTKSARKAPAATSNPWARSHHFNVVPSVPVTLAGQIRQRLDDDDETAAEPYVIEDVKTSHAGKVPNEPEAITALLNDPPRLFYMLLENDKEEAENRRREKFLREALDLHPGNLTSLAKARTYIAFMSARPSTFSTYASHIRNLIHAKLPLTPTGVADYLTLRYVQDDPLSNVHGQRMLSAVNYFSACLGVLGDEAFFHHFNNGLAYLNPAGDTRIRGSIGRDEIEQIIQHREFKDDPILQQGLRWQAAFGFRSGRMAFLKVSDFSEITVDGKKTLRFTGLKQKDAGAGYQKNTIDIQTALPEWYDEIIGHLSAKRVKMTNPNDLVDDPKLFPKWSPAIVNAKIKIATAELKFDSSLEWVSHGIRKGSAGRAATAAGEEFGWKSLGCLEHISSSVRSVLGQKGDDIALDYALNNNHKALLVNMQIATIGSRRVCMNQNSKFFEKIERHYQEGRVLLEGADAALPATLPPVRLQKAKVSDEGMENALSSQLKQKIRGRDLQGKYNQGSILHQRVPSNKKGKRTAQKTTAAGKKNKVARKRK